MNFKAIFMHFRGEDDDCGMEPHEIEAVDSETAFKLANLIPGKFYKMKAEVECEDCDGEGTLDESDCCGASLIGGGDDKLCKDCKEHSQKAICDTCKGTGKIWKEITREEKIIQT